MEIYFAEFPPCCCCPPLLPCCCPLPPCCRLLPPVGFGVPLLSGLVPSGLLPAELPKSASSPRAPLSAPFRLQPSPTPRPASWPAASALLLSASTLLPALAAGRIRRAAAER